MSTPSLHIVNKSSLDSNALTSCLAVSTPGDCLLLIEDGAYSVLDPSGLQTLLHAHLEIYVLAEDMQARGLDAGSLDSRLCCVDYAGFVALACRCARTVSWS